MIIKTPQEIEAMREGGKILASILSEVGKLVVPGTSTMDLEKKAEELFKKHQVKPSFKGYHGYPYILCTSINENIVHTFPNKNAILKEGDIINIDCGVTHKGLITDHAVTFIAGKASTETEMFVATCYKALAAGIKEAKAGQKVGAIGNKIQNIIEGAGYHIIKDLVGHGVGRELHEAPQIPNFGAKNSGETLVPGLTLAIEPIVSMGSTIIKTLENGWDMVTSDSSLSCQVEHTILITNGEAEILTKV